MDSQEDLNTLQKVPEHHYYYMLKCLTIHLQMTRSLSFKFSNKEQPNKEEASSLKPKKIDADSWLRDNTKTRKNNIKEGPPKNLRYGNKYVDFFSF